MNRSAASLPLPGLSLLALWTAAFALACYTLQHPARAAGGQESFWALVFGSGRTALGQTLYQRADVYFHGGVANSEHPAFTDCFQRWAETIAPHRHVHATSATIFETLPWYQWATQLDPQNVDAWLDAAYAAGVMAQRPELADRILTEGLRHNPRHFQLYLERGRLYLRRSDWPRAAYALDVALRLFPSSRPADNIEARQALLSLLTLDSFAHEILGERDPALARLRWLLQLAPANAVARARLAALERGADTRQAALGYLREALTGEHVCDRAAADGSLTGHKHDEHDD